MARTPRVVEDRREQIIDAAMRVFSQKGFTRATNKDIAHEAGITAGLIYHYFENKKAVLDAIIEERSPWRTVRSLSPHVLALPPEQFLRLLVPQVLSIVEEEKFVQLIHVLLPEAIHNPEIGHPMAETLGKMVNFLTDYFSSKMVNGELRQGNAALAAQTLLGCVTGFVLRRQVLRDPTALEYTHEQIAEVIVETLLKGLLPR
ncbi:MAG: TetR/AcrR family transcriptional regulator [Chloroflexi bacterium]|nr:TetR/AcrR family transcriptional regulator [Ktedonobacteraceae bacterium]MBV9708534.1 TetR/AcrR family transcriptional regulator [Chloroflexota bacterium]